jgi:hypothetical protein
VITNVKILGHSAHTYTTKTRFIVQKIYMCFFRLDGAFARSERGMLVRDQAGDAAHVGADHRHAGRQRFQNRDRQIVDPAGARS